ncbi:MAG: class I SAM-dependent methyltransferase [Chloroflexi bacterium]|nr:class I SAM-dependent methyltransferase [Chloroflexota bacterium]
MTPAPGSVVEDAPVREKRAFYRNERVAQSYDAQRFGGASGGRVNERELDIMLSLLPRGGVIADVGCGTGRLTQALRKRGDRVISFDASRAMLTVAVSNGAGPVVQADAFDLPLAAGTCIGVAALRLLFHFENLSPLLREFRRITQTGGGSLAFDSYTWSARAFLPLGASRWGAKVYTHSRDAVAAVAEQTGWRIVEERRAFLFSPYLYRRLPLRLVRFLERVEHLAPTVLLCRSFWRLEAIASDGA